MNQNFIGDNFIFNLPSTFVPKLIEDRYSIGLKNLKKPYGSVIDYLNSSIKEVVLPVFTFPTVKQTKLYGTEVNFRGFQVAQNLFSRDLTINVNNVDGGLSWFIFLDCMLYHYFVKGQIFISDFIITVLDISQEERRELFRITFKELVPSGLSDIKFSNSVKDNNVKDNTVTFKFNNMDIEFIPQYETESPEGELIEHFSDRILPNDDSVPKTLEDYLNL